MTVPKEQPVAFIIDDDATVRESVADLLSSVGLAARTFGSTRESWTARAPTRLDASCSTSGYLDRADWSFKARWRDQASIFRSYSSPVTAISPCRCGP